MPTRLTWSFYGEAQVDRSLGRIELAGQDASPAFEALAEHFLAIEAAQFASEGSTSSGGWAPLSESYAAWKELHYPGKPILERTGSLKRSLVDGPAIRVIEPHLMVLGSDVDYGAYHQTGTDRMPRRRPIELTEETRRSWVKVIQRWIVTGGLRGAASEV